jgi:hypothetical protein
VSNTPTIGSTALTQAQLPAYSLPVTDPGHNHAITDPGHDHTFPTVSQGGYGSGGANFGDNNAFFGQTGTTHPAETGIAINTHTTGVTVASGGSGATHTHTSSVVPTLPPYYALAFIIKL